MDCDKLNALNPVTLAYVGDAVFSLYVRLYVVNTADFKAGELNKKVNSCVKATAQATMLEKLAPLLTEQEKEIVRRGRNCHTPSKAKNVSLSDYKRATALEALFGWLYLNKSFERLEELEAICVKSVL